MPSVLAGGSHGLVPRCPPVTALASAAFAAKPIREDESKASGSARKPRRRQGRVGRKQMPIGVMYPAAPFIAPRGSKSVCSARGTRALSFESVSPRPFFSRCENPAGWTTPEPGSGLPEPGHAHSKPGLEARVREVGVGRKLQPGEWAEPETLRRGFKRRWKDTRVTVGTTFGERSRVFLVGELSKFPLPYDSFGGKCWVPVALRVPASCKQGDPRISGLCRGWCLGSSLHKHPHPSTCLRLPARLDAAADLCKPQTGVPKMVLPHFYHGAS
ncbi:PREDICTED: uncharacterized protein LOC102867200 [Elephantulus edwardii]|uniref:uncharacterized protein LOC102867200 n=1 Tax=Elephantulus edwardii TaxID=28737 RepID=UPI0003F0AA70|nr:PREDICTED: uncharacterized protein LOC102867200 [Elephantulus edwardii]